MLWKNFNARMRSVAAYYSVLIWIGIVGEESSDNGIAVNIERVNHTDGRLINNTDRNCCRAARALGIADRVLETVRAYISTVRSVKNVSIAIIRYRGMRRHGGKGIDE
jgi:hypothetical protein